MKTIGRNGVGIAVNRDNSVDKILHQLTELNDRQLEMVSEYIRGLHAADIFLSR